MLFGVEIHSKGDPDIAHLTFTQKSKSGGNRIASRFKFQPSKGVSLFQEGVSPSLLEKKRGEKNRKKERDIKKGEKKKNKIKREKNKERKEEGKSGREPATFT